MANKLGRNQPCWCGSGKKYKQCHLDRDKQERVKPWEIEKDLRAAFSSEICSVPESWRAWCVGRPIRAHTVPKSGSLNAIARSGHVYAFAPSFSALTKHSGRVPPKLLGVNRASTFSGFCAKHDAELFAPLEQQRFASSREQCFLLAYRALCREIYTKKASAALSEARRNLDKGLPRSKHLAIQAYSFLLDLGIATGLRNNELHRREYEAMLLSKRYDDVRAYIVKLEHPPDVMCAGGISPERTFEGEILQDMGDIEHEGQFLSVASFAEQGEGYVVLSWLPSSDDVCERFVRSLERVDDRLLTDALIRMMFEESENVFLRPEWWESLPQSHQKALIHRMSNVLEHFEGDKAPSDLSDDGVRFPEWRMRSRLRL